MDMGSCDKLEILVKARQALVKVIAEAKGLGDTFRDEASGYPSAMESHSDTNRSQNQHMEMAARRAAFGLEFGLSDLDYLIHKWNEMEHSQEKVEIGSLVKIRYETGDELLVLLVPGRATAKIEHEGSEIMVLPIEATLGRVLRGCRQGEVVTLQTKVDTDITISELY